MIDIISKEKGFMVFIGIIVLIGVVFVSQFLFSSNSSLTGYSSSVVSHDAMDNFAKCLSDSNAVFYGTTWCSHCNAQKESFGDSVRLINYVDCDKNRNVCMAKGIQGYPTWIFGDGTMAVGGQTVTTLAEYSGCEI